MKIESVSDLLKHTTLAKNGCMEWNGSRNGGGYGLVIYKGKRFLAHRLSVELANKQTIPSGFHVCHKCDNPRCINPDHLFIGTPKDNVHDAMNKGRFFKPPHVPLHGTISEYANFKCRCEECKRAWRDYYRSIYTKEARRAKNERVKLRQTAS